MTSPYILPDWLPWWIALILVVAALVYALIFLLVPFSVFGVKPRLEAIEEQLQAMQEELRTISLRLPDAPRRTGTQAGVDDFAYNQPVRQPRTAEPASRLPPIPPAPPPALRDVSRETPVQDSQHQNFDRDADPDFAGRIPVVREPLGREPLAREPLAREPTGRPRNPPQRTAGKRIEPRLD